MKAGGRLLGLTFVAKKNLISFLAVCWLSLIFATWGSINRLGSKGLSRVSPLYDVLAAFSSLLSFFPSISASSSMQEAPNTEKRVYRGRAQLSTLCTAVG